MGEEGKPIPEVTGAELLGKLAAAAVKVKRGPGRPMKNPGPDHPTRRANTVKAKRKEEFDKALADGSIPDRKMLIRYLWAEARSATSEPAKVSAVKALDNLLPPEPPSEDDSGEHTPADARKLILEHFGDDIENGEATPEVVAAVTNFP
jgi:hypothetical protein